MILRGQLKEGQYVRIQTMLDDDFWHRPLAGRYFRIFRPASDPDDAKAWSPCSGSFICWSINYFNQVFNDYMEPVSEAEQKRIEYIFQHKDEFKDLFRLGRKIERQVEIVERIIEDEIGEYDLNIWEFSDVQHLINEVGECACDNFEEDELNDLLDDLKDAFNDLLKLLEQLTELEDKYVRQYEIRAKD